MQIVPSFVFVAGMVAAVASPAFAEQPLSAGRLTDLRVERERVDSASPRGVGFAGAFVTMHDELENFPLNTSFGGTGVSAPPTSFTGPPGFQWPLNNLRGQSGGPAGEAPFVRLIDLSLDPVGGPNGVINATRAIRLFSSVAQPAGGFFLGANLRFGGQPDEPTLPLEPLAGANARVSAEHWVSSIDTLYTFESASVHAGFVTGRLMWGGTCVEDAPGDCTDIGLPMGPLSYMVSLGRTPAYFTPIFLPATYCETAWGETIPGCDPPPGFQVGDLVSPPIGQWSRLVYESTSDGRTSFLLDHLDGGGETVIYHNILLSSTAYIDRVGWNASYEAQGEFMLIDNIEASGYVVDTSIGPPLECPYLDDLEWLELGLLLDQAPRWEAAPLSEAVIVSDAEGGRVLRQTNNVSPDDYYRREVSTELPASSATIGNDLVATVRARTTGGAVRGVALFGETGLAARLYFGRDTAAAPFEPSAYVQINPLHNPIDDPLGSDPLANNPVIGVDMVDTGYDWIMGIYRTVELRISVNGALRVSIDGQRIYTGVGAFADTIDRFAFESENNTSGVNASLRIDDITLTCDVLSCAADFDFDDAVTFADLNAVLSNFGATGLIGFNPGDADGDGDVDFADLNAVLSAYGTSCE